MNYIKATDIKSLHVNSDDAETTITFSRKDDTALIWTSDNTVLTKLKKTLSRDSRGTYRCREGSLDSDGNLTGYFFECPKNLIRFGNVKNISSEQQSACSERFKKMWENKRNGL